MRFAAVAVAPLLGWPPLPCAAVQDVAPERSAVTVEVTYTGDVAAVVAGGSARRVVYLDNLDLTVTLRLAELLGVPGATLFLYGLGNQGGSPSTAAGDAQGVSNIEAPTSWRLYEAWFQQNLLGNRLSVLAGLYDLNSEFDFGQTPALFLHSSHGMGAEYGLSGRNGPSIFPVTSLGVRLKGRVGRRAYVQAALLDGVPGDTARPRGTHVRLDAGDGVLLALEGGLVWRVTEAVPERTRTGRRRRIGRGSAAAYRAKVALGVWAYTTDFPDLAEGGPDGSPLVRDGSVGAYALADVPLVREADPTQGLALFGRVGFADSRVNRFGTYAGLAAVYSGPFAGRDDDQVGVAVALARNGTPFMRSRTRTGIPVTRAEVAVEVTYRARLWPWLDVQADVQYVADPDTRPGVADALVLAGRVQLGL